MITAPGGIRAAPARDQLDQFIKKFVMCPWCGECRCTYFVHVVASNCFDGLLRLPNSMTQSVICETLDDIYTVTKLTSTKSTNKISNFLTTQ